MSSYTMANLFRDGDYVCVLDLDDSVHDPKEIYIASEDGRIGERTLTRVISRDKIRDYFNLPQEWWEETGFDRQEVEYMFHQGWISVFADR